MQVNKSETMNKGFTLLYALLIITLVFSVSASVMQIMTKELRLANFGEVSQIALYAAKSGSDCALYWAIQGAFDEGRVITCMSQNFDVGPGRNNFTLDIPGRGCASVTVNNVTGEIRSRGYNTSCSVTTGFRVERGIVERYK